jgi:hypothetical protein
VSAPHEAVDQEGIFVAILSQGFWDLNMTKPATENLSERARQVAARGQVFDVEYVNRIVERLDRTGIEAVRRSQVVNLLKDELKVCHQTHNVFVVTFSNKHDANKARKKARLSFAVVPGPIPIIFGFSVKAESHLFEDNRVFVCDVKRNTVNHDTVLRHVREALQGPMADSFCFYIQEIRNKNQRLKRTRYILRVYDGVPPLSVERFYIPLDAADGKGHVRGIFKPWSKGWQCPACHEKCQAGGTSTCNSAELLHPQEHMK